MVAKNGDRSGQILHILCEVSGIQTTQPAQGRSPSFATIGRWAMGISRNGLRRPVSSHGWTRLLVGNRVQVYINGTSHSYPYDQHGRGLSSNIFQGNIQTAWATRINSLRQRPQVYISILARTSPITRHQAPDVNRVPPSNGRNV